MLCYKDLVNANEDHFAKATPDFFETDLVLVFLAIVALCDPLREEATDAIKRCKSSGITVRMLTGDSKMTAISIAKECGILP